MKNKNNVQQLDKLEMKQNHKPLLMPQPLPVQTIQDKYSWCTNQNFYNWVVRVIACEMRHHHNRPINKLDIKHVVKIV